MESRESHLIGLPWIGRQKRKAVFWSCTIGVKLFLFFFLFATSQLTKVAALYRHTAWLTEGYGLSNIYSIIPGSKMGEIDR